MEKPTPAQLLRVFNRYELLEIVLDDFAAEVKTVGGDPELMRLYFGHASAKAALEGAMHRKKRAIESARKETPEPAGGDVIQFPRAANG